MNYDAIIRDSETGRGRKVLVLVLALIVVALVIGTVARGFKGNSTDSGARALINGAVICLVARATLRDRLRGGEPPLLS